MFYLFAGNRVNESNGVFRQLTTTMAQADHPEYQRALNGTHPLSRWNRTEPTRTLALAHRQCRCPGALIATMMSEMIP
jgi:hypothetical protein